MEHFIVSARKYRPTQFNEVVGQHSITETLENAIDNHHLAQALLFTGPRGVGKTTCARILAKRINESNTTQTDEDFAFNIFELDAASNNSVDDIRELIDQVRIPPQVGKYKVYIIDEVHMLSTAAFNAFLKTLEEPPKHAIFILATTEKHKIIPTILSRCQIFDFKRIGVLDIKNHLKEIAEKEGIQADDDALHIIAQKADGALRDALSSFDRVVGFSGKHLTREAVAENLNVLDYSYYFEITYLILKNDIPNLFLAYNRILNKGYDGHQFIRGLASHFRDLLVGGNQITAELLEVGENVKAMYIKQAQMSTPVFLQQAISIANTCDLNYKNSQNQRLLVELCLLELASLNNKEEKKTKIERVVIPPDKIIKSTQTSTTKEEKEVKPKKNSTNSSHKESKPILNPEHQASTISDQEKSKIEAVKSKESVTNDAITSDKQTQLQEENNKKPTPRRVSAFSLNSIQQKQEIKREINSNKPQEVQKPTQAFTQNDLEKAWKEYTHKVSQHKQHNLASHLGMTTPTLKGTIAHVEYPNNTIKIEVERDKGNLLRFIREKLQNYNFDIEIKVNETITKKYAFTDREIYDKMAEINPNLHLFRQELDLEL